MNDLVVDTINPFNQHIDMIKTSHNNAFIISSNVIYFYRLNNSPPYVTEIGPLDLQITSIRDFSISPDGDLAVIFHSDSFADF